MPILNDIEIKKGKGKKIFYSIMFILILGIPLEVFPYYWMLINSFKTNLEIIKMPPTFWPKVWNLQGFVAAFTKFHIWDTLWQTAVILFWCIVIQVSIMTLGAFALSKLKLKGKNILLIYCLGTMMISGQALMTPTYMMMIKFPIINVNLINNNLSLILAFSSWAYTLFMCKAFFDQLPDELMESGRIDGAGNLRMFFQIVLPLSKPVIAINCLNTFIAVYNQFAFPIMLLQREDTWTVMVRIYASLNTPDMSWNYMMIMLSTATLPVIIAYLATQKFVVQGISTLGLKG